MTLKKGLGRGLDSLLGDTGSEARRVLEVEIHRLRPNPRQPREHFEEATLEDLARSISVSGVLQPILVRPANGGYEIIAGERRWRAAQKASLHTVPVLVREVADSQMLELALVENLQRENLNPVEEARAYQILVEDLNLTQEEVARRVGKDRATVANTLRLLNLPEDAIGALEGGRISTGHAKAILAHKKREEQERLLREILQRGLSVREAERYKSRPRAGKRADADTLEASQALTRAVGYPVEIRRRGKGGEVRIRFRNEEELQVVYERLIGN